MTKQRRLFRQLDYSIDWMLYTVSIFVQAMVAPAVECQMEYSIVGHRMRGTPFKEIETWSFKFLMYLSQSSSLSILCTRKYVKFWPVIMRRQSSSTIYSLSVIGPVTSFMKIMIHALVFFVLGLSLLEIRTLCNDHAYTDMAVSTHRPRDDSWREIVIHPRKERAER